MFLNVILSLSLSLSIETALTVDLDVSPEGRSSSGVVGFTLIASSVVQLDVWNLQYSLRLAESSLFWDVPIDLPPRDGWNRTERETQRI